jgi:prepilin-type N-terminal cleavage/methylation domain-containing protein
MRKRSKAFTLIELLVVIAIIALLISILLPSLSRARELSKRTVCSSNMRGIGQGMYLYAQDDPGVFPAISVQNDNGQVRLFSVLDWTAEPSTTGIPSVTVDLWTVVRSNNSTPKQFTCPSTTDVPDPAQDATAYFDFQRLTNIGSNLSFAYQNQHDKQRPVIGTSSEPTFPFMADANPYVKGALSATDLLGDRTSSFRGNSNNHTNREGQNVMFVDSHVTFEKGPDAGLPGSVSSSLKVSKGRDHIYTTHNTGGATTVDPGNNAPVGLGTATTTCDLGTKSDACMVP